MNLFKQNKTKLKQSNQQYQQIQKNLEHKIPKSIEIIGIINIFWILMFVYSFYKIICGYISSLEISISLLSIIASGITYYIIVKMYTHYSNKNNDGKGNSKGNSKK